MKKVYLTILIFAIIACLTSIPYFIDGIASRGMGGVNYGRILFPLLIGIVSFWLYQKKK